MHRDLTLVELINSCNDEPLTQPVESLKGHVGIYIIIENDERIIQLEDGALYGQRTRGSQVKLIPFSPDRSL